MLQRMQLFPLNFYKKAKFNGSLGKMHFRLEKKEVETKEGEKNTILLGSIWPGPFCYDATNKDEIVTKEFTFSEDGICDAKDWFNQESITYNK